MMYSSIFYDVACDEYTENASGGHMMVCMS